MRLLGYYMFHSFVNQMRKLFKTWVLIFLLVCGLVGGLIGFGVATLEDVAENQASVSVSEEYEEVADEETGEEDSNAEDTGEDDAIGFAAPEGGVWSELTGSLTTEGLIEFFAGVIILAVFLFEMFSADKNGSKIFLPADVNLLFASPMKPQSVLLFRLMMQLGMIVLLTVYLLLEIPTLMIDFGLNLAAVIGIFGTWLGTLLIGKLLNVLCYTLSATWPQKKKYIRFGVYAIVLLLIAGIFAYSSVTGVSYAAAVSGFLNHPASRWIPLWGWTKWFCMSMVSGNVAASVGTGLLLLASILVLIFLIWNIKADFYEDAMAKSEETAAVMEAQTAQESVGFVKRKKDRSEKLRRDGMTHGSGANVFFYKSMYNRFRFAWFGIFTKTTLTYLVTAIAVAVFCRLAGNTYGYLPPVLAIAIFVFYRTLGNPLEEDTSKDLFRMVPESAWSKLFWSVLGGTVNCLLDLIPAFLAIIIICRTNPLTVLAWIPFLLAIDFYGTNVGTFINLSVPVSAGKMVKQIVQVMFIYFGLLPAIVIMAIGIVLNHVVVAAVIAAWVCVLVGLLFLALTPMLIEFQEKPARR